MTEGMDGKDKARRFYLKLDSTVLNPYMSLAPSWIVPFSKDKVSEQKKQQRLPKAAFHSKT